MNVFDPAKRASMETIDKKKNTPSLPGRSKGNEPEDADVLCGQNDRSLGD